MRLTPVRLIVFRVINITLSRFRLGDRLLRGALGAMLVSKSAEPYCQSADFFTFDQLAVDERDDNRGGTS